jgi:hypothetical protein
MKKIITIIALMIATSVSAQTKVAGYAMPNTVLANGTTLIMNGGGMREKMIFDLYVGVLYLESNNSDANEILKADKSMAIKLRITSGMIDKENMEEAIREGFDKATNGNSTNLKKDIDNLINKGFADDIVKGDVFDLIYVPGKGTILAKNNKMLVNIKGLAFKTALFGIWLCDQPADSNLKAKMLGK